MQPLDLAAAHPMSTNLEHLEAVLEAKLRGRIRHLQLVQADDGIILRGKAQTYYAKQLAQHAILAETDLPIRANEIEVG